MKPGDFLIGIRDFFAILVPGAAFLVLNMPGFIHGSAGSVSSLVLFGLTIAAYLIGSVASALGSLLDFIADGVIESRRFRGSRLGKKLAQRKRLANRLRCQLLRERAPCTAPSLHPENVKSFWWTHLRLNCPQAMLELDRLEAVQKLFRSLVAVFIAVAFIQAVGEAPKGAVGSPGLLLIAAAVAAGLYAGGRYAFLAAVYRLAGAYCVSREVAPR